MIAQDQQKPLDSGFDRSATGSDVLAGLDLRGRQAIVTGGHSGLGLETTKVLSGAGACVIVAARDTDRARATTAGLAHVEIIPLDLADLRSVQRFAARLLDAGRVVDILINNAGIMACPEERIGPGWEAQFGINHLGHFALTVQLLPLLRDGSRIVCVSSAGHHLSKIRWNDPQFAKGYDKWKAYAQSKTANILFAVQLDKLSGRAGLKAFAVHPGKIFTPLQRHLTKSEMVAEGWIGADGTPADPTFKSPQQGCATALWAATSSKLAMLGGLYCEDSDVAMRAELCAEPFRGVMDYATDPEESSRLWHLSLELTGLR